MVFARMPCIISMAAVVHDTFAESTMVGLQHGAANGGGPLRPVQDLRCSLHSRLQALPAADTTDAVSADSKKVTHTHTHTHTSSQFSQQNRLAHFQSTWHHWHVYVRQYQAARCSYAHWFEVFGCSEPGTGEGARLGCVSPARLHATCSGVRV